MQLNVCAHPTLESNRARVALSDAEHSLKLTQDEQRTANEDLSDIFDPDGFGPEGEWKKLDGMCLSKDTGEYVLLLRTTWNYTHVSQVHLRSLPL